MTWEAGDGGPGHAFNVVRHPRLGVVFLDGQAGREAVFPPGQRLVRFAPMTDGIPGPATVPGGPGPGGPVPLGAMTSHLAGTGEPGGTAAGEAAPLPGGARTARDWRDLLAPSQRAGRRRRRRPVAGQDAAAAGPGRARAPGQPRAAPAGESLLGMLEGAGLSAPRPGYCRCPPGQTPALGVSPGAGTAPVAVGWPS